MKQTVSFRRSNLFRRICAFLLDLIFALGIFVFVDACITTPIFDATTDIVSLNEEYQQLLLKSHLYILNANDDIEIITTDYDTRLTYFYTNYDSINNYNQIKAESSYFVFNEEENKYVVKDDVDVKELNEFYRLTVVSARDNILAKDEMVLKTSLKIQAYTLTMALINGVVAVVVIFLVFPLVFKDRATLGMKLFHLKVVNKSNGEYTSILQSIFRFLLVVTLYFLAGYYTFGLVPLISALMVCFTQSHISVIDLLCANYVIDDGQYPNEPKEKELIVITYDDGKEGKETDE